MLLLWFDLSFPEPATELHLIILNFIKTNIITIEKELHSSSTFVYKAKKLNSYCSFCVVLEIHSKILT